MLGLEPCGRQRRIRAFWWRWHVTPPATPRRPICEAQAFGSAVGWATLGGPATAPEPLGRLTEGGRPGAWPPWPRAAGALTRADRECASSGWGTWPAAPCGSGLLALALVVPVNRPRPPEFDLPGQRDAPWPVRGRSGRASQSPIEETVSDLGLGRARTVEMPVRPSGAIMRPLSGRRSRVGAGKDRHRWRLADGDLLSARPSGSRAASDPARTRWARCSRPVPARGDGRTARPEDLRPCRVQPVGADHELEATPVATREGDVDPVRVLGELDDPVAEDVFGVVAGVVVQHLGEVSAQDLDLRDVPVAVVLVRAIGLQHVPVRVHRVGTGRVGRTLPAPPRRGPCAG